MGGMNPHPPTALDCQIRVSAKINPSEDPQKVRQAVSGIFPNFTIRMDASRVSAESSNLQSLEHICQDIRARQAQGTYRRCLLGNMQDNSTWFYLNKQAALAGRVAICETASESPLGPITVTITSLGIDEVVVWMVSATNS